MTGEDDEEPDNRGGLTDRDCYALLSVGGMGGKNGFTLADYGELSDRQIIILLRIKWTEEGELVSELDEMGQSGRIHSVGRDLPTPETLGLTREDIVWGLSVKPNISSFYLIMFWNVWCKRGKSKEEIARLWVDHMHSRN